MTFLSAKCLAPRRRNGDAGARRFIRPDAMTRDPIQNLMPETKRHESLRAHCRVIDEMRYRQEGMAAFIFAVNSVEHIFVGPVIPDQYAVWIDERCCFLHVSRPSCACSVLNVGTAELVSS